MYVYTCRGTAIKWQCQQTKLKCAIGSSQSERQFGADIEDRHWLRDKGQSVEGQWIRDGENG
jgi:hypothetical protein